MDSDIVLTLETAYRAALIDISSNPRFINNGTSRSFREFVDDMLYFLLAVFSSRTKSPDPLDMLLIPRHSLLTIVAELVQNATPASNPKHRNARYRRSLMLWSTLFQIMSERQGQELEYRSQYWPVSLRRRFVCALANRRRKRWPHNPYSSPAVSITFKCHTLTAVLDLGATLPSDNAKSRI